MELPFADPRNNMARAADMMTEFAREMQEELNREEEARDVLHR